MIPRRAFQRCLRSVEKQAQLREGYVRFLERVPVFDRLDAELKTRVATKFTEQRFSRGDTVFKQGDEGYLFFLVYRGELELSGGCSCSNSSCPSCCTTARLEDQQ